jgi:predicted nuclease with RNAse H fold
MPKGERYMASVCGIDAGSLKTLSYVAWLSDKRIIFDLYVPTVDHPLPSIPVEIRDVVGYAIDAPQSLPARGQVCRKCDKEARTPTRRLPCTLLELERTVLYRAFVECGVRLFAALSQSREYMMVGLELQSRLPKVMETYPRAVALQLGFGPLPSKRQKPFEYVERVWAGLRGLGYHCNDVVRPTVDQIDAVLCAVAAQSECEDRSELLGEAPIWDKAESVLREGFIVLPRHE